jgi:predicted aspartyl protease
MDFLIRHSLDIDWDRHRIAISDRTPAEMIDAPLQIPINCNDFAIPSVTVEFGELHQATVEVDTGFIGSVFLSRSEASKVDLGKTCEHAIEYASVNGTNCQSVARLERLVVCGNEIRDSVCALGSDRASSSIGCGILRKFRCTFDFPNGVLRATAPSAHHESEEIDMSGMHVFRSDMRLIVRNVDPGSPAERAGVVAGDLVEAINGQPSRCLRVSQVRALLSCGDGVSIQLELSDGKTSRVVEFRPVQ